MKKAQEKERLLKTKEFAREQREKAARKAQQQKKQQKEEAGRKPEPNPHAYKNTHAVTNQSQRQSSASPERLLAQKKINSTIMEQDGEESDASALNIVTGDQITKREIEEKTKAVEKYKRID